MQIITISPARLSQRVWLKFDNDSLLPLRIDDVATLHLKKFTDISTEEYQRLQRYSANYLLHEYAIRQLSISPKTKLSLTQKLKIYSQKIIYKYNFSSSLISSLQTDVVNDIVAKGLLNDQDYIDYYIKRHPRKSLSELKYFFQSQGINGSLSLAVSDKEKIMTLVKKQSRHLDLTDVNTKNKLISFFFRKGFAISVVKTTIDEYLKSR